MKLTQASRIILVVAGLVLVLLLLFPPFRIKTTVT